MKQISQLTVTPITPAPTQTPYEVLGTVWTELRELCKTKLPEADCNALLGYRPIYFPPAIQPKPLIPAWGYALVGFIIGKFL